MAIEASLHSTDSEVRLFFRVSGVLKLRFYSPKSKQITILWDDDRRHATPMPE